MVCSVCNREEEVKVSKVMSKLVSIGCPFVCPQCKRYVFNYRAIRDIVLIWPIPLPPTFVEDGLIVRPENLDDPSDELYGRSDYGIILSYGPGCYVGKEFHPTSGLEVGMKVVYDKLVPWGTYVKGYDGRENFVVICGFRDVRGVVEEE